jgi:hypothetical protein
VSLALDPVAMLLNSAACLWQELEQYAELDVRPRYSALDTWLAKGAYQQGLDPNQIWQLRRDYRRLCSLLDHLETLLCDDGKEAVEAVRARIAEQITTEAIANL